MANSHIITNTNINTFANWLGIHPLNFNGLDLTGCIGNFEQYCLAFYNQFTWQTGSTVSIEEMSNALLSAEQSVMDFINGTANKKWITKEKHIWPYYHRQEHGKLFSINNCDGVKFQTNFNCLENVGQRINTFVQNIDITSATIDLDGDTINETIEISVTLPVTLTGTNSLTIPVSDLENLKFYHPNQNGNEEFVILHKLISFDPNTRIAIFRIPLWLTVKLGLYYFESFTTRMFNNFCDPTVFIDSIDLYYESVDECKPNAEVIWNDSSDCSLGCPEVRIPACMNLIDTNLITLQLQALDIVTGCAVDSGHICPPPCWPSYVELNYQTTNNKVLEHCIFMIAAARLPKLLCHCQGCHENNFNRWQDNVNDVSDGTVKYVYPFEERLNPIGSRVGEIEAWKKLSLLKENGLC